MGSMIAASDLRLRRVVEIGPWMLAMAGIGGPNLACRADGEAEADAPSVETSSTTTTDNPDDSSSASSDDSTSDSSTSGGPTPAPAAARGIEIVAVDANQGVSVPIGRDGQGVPAEDRVTRVLAGRPMAIRAAAAIAPSFERRLIEAHLLLQAPGGSVDRLVVDAEDGSSDANDDGVVEGAFMWSVEASRVVAGVSYAIELYEHGVEEADPDPPAAPRFPTADGATAPIGIEDANQRIELVLVPIQYDDGNGCVTEVEYDEALLDHFASTIYMQNPVVDVTLSVREPLRIDEEMPDHGDVLARVRDARLADNPPPEVFYFGWIEACEGTSLAQWGGIATIPESFTPGNAYLRVGAAVWAGYDLEWMGNVLVHELGHNLGRRHVLCDGTEADVDGAYPVDGGRLDTLGLGVLDGRLRDPADHAELMSYCHPRWPSVYGWGRVEPVIREISSWSERDHRAEGTAGPVLIGTISMSGAIAWSTARGGPPSPGPSDAEHEIELAFADGRTSTVAARVVDLADYDGKWIVAPLPDDFAPDTAVAHRHLGLVTPIERAAIREDHERSPR